MEKRKAWNRINFTKEEEQEIIFLYKEKLWSHKKLMKKFGVNHSVIGRVLRENNIPPNKIIDYRKVNPWSKKISFSNDETTKIINLFENKLLSAKDIGKEMGCSGFPIYRILKERGIDTSVSTRLKKQIISGKRKILRGKEHPCYGKKPHNLVEFSNEQKKEIIYLYQTKLLNLILIGRKFSCDPNVIRRILKEKNINTSSSHRRKLLVDKEKILIGNLNPNWRGGIQYEPYDESFNNKFKRAIRKRDNYICLKCGKHQEKENNSLTIHHINYDKKMSVLQNCCALCNRCNVEVNFNRPHWTKFFQSLLSEKYGYQYSQEGEIILEINNENN